MQVSIMTIWRYKTLFQLFSLLPCLLSYPAGSISFWYAYFLLYVFDC